MTKRVVRHLICAQGETGAVPKNIALNGRLRLETATERRARHLKEQERLGHFVPTGKGPRKAATYRGAAARG